MPSLPSLRLLLLGITLLRLIAARHQGSGVVSLPPAAQTDADCGPGRLSTANFELGCICIAANNPVSMLIVLIILQVSWLCCRGRLSFFDLFTQNEWGPYSNPSLGRICTTYEREDSMVGACTSRWARFCYPKKNGSSTRGRDQTKFTDECIPIIVVWFFSRIRDRSTGLYISTPSCKIGCSKGYVVFQNLATRVLGLIGLWVNKVSSKLWPHLLYHGSHNITSAKKEARGQLPTGFGAGFGQERSSVSRGDESLSTADS